jgi:hypothetical protein
MVLAQEARLEAFATIGCAREVSGSWTGLLERGVIVGLWLKSIPPLLARSGSGPEATRSSLPGHGIVVLAVGLALLLAPYMCLTYRRNLQHVPRA